MPLLIGGATTSRVHTAVKISPNYIKGPGDLRARREPRRRRRLDAAVGQRDASGYVAGIRAEYVKVRDAHLRHEQSKRRITLAAARQNTFKIDWNGLHAARSRASSARGRSRSYDLAELVPYIDWTPFFQTWELAGRYPKILDDDKVGAEARKLFADAQAMLKRIVAEKWLDAPTPSSASGPPTPSATTSRSTTRDARGKPIAMLHTLRQQIARDPGRDRAHTALADFVAPKDTGLADYIGGFAVTAGVGEEEALERHLKKTDDYGRIMLKALSDRLAEAFAERMHERVRRELWGYAKSEKLSIEDLILEKYRGIRPAPGYPAQPDHTEKATLFRLLDAEAQAGIQLTESFAMWPGASVSGLYFSHPESHYFGVGKVERDQVEDYARRKGWTIAECERWLAPVLNYDPAPAEPQAA